MRLIRSPLLSVFSWNLKFSLETRYTCPHIVLTPHVHQQRFTPNDRSECKKVNSANSKSRAINETLQVITSSEVNIPSPLE